MPSDHLRLERIADMHLDWEYLIFPSMLLWNNNNASLLAIPGTKVFLDLWQPKKSVGPPALVSHNNFESGHLCFQVDDIYQNHTV